MNRFMLFVTCVLTCALLGLPASADDPPKKLTFVERLELEAKFKESHRAGGAALDAGKYSEATKSWEEALKLARQLYPKADFPDGHADLAACINNLAFLYSSQGKLADAEPLYKDALVMNKRLNKGDHPGTASSLSDLAFLYQAQGKYADAEMLYKDALDMRKRLFKGDHPDTAISLNNLAYLYEAQGKYTDAEMLYKEVLGVYKRLFKGDHPSLATTLDNLAYLYRGQGKYVEAEPLAKNALAMYKRLFKGDHPDVAICLDNLGRLYFEQGKLADAEPLYKDALSMRKKLFNGDHPAVANSLSSLALLYLKQEKYGEAEPLQKDALGMRKRLFKGDHPDVAHALNNLAALYRAQRKYADAEPLHKGAYDMYKRLFKGDHPDVAIALNNLAYLYESQGEYAKAEPLYKDAVEMNKRLYKGDHPAVALSLSNLAFLSQFLEKHADAAKQFREALAMARRLTTAFARQKAEGEALTLTASRPLYRDVFLTHEQLRKGDPATVYPEVWADKGLVARLSEQRQLQARAAVDSRAADLLKQLADARQRRAELLLAPATKEPGTLKKRASDLNSLEATITELDERIRPLLPTIARTEQLDAAGPVELQKVLSADAVIVDFVHYTFFEFDKLKPGEAGAKQTGRYLAFVVMKDKVAWVDLGTAAQIAAAVTAWRDAITSGKVIPDAIPAKVRELVWEKIRKELPAGIKTVYMCPDTDLCRVPWGALPGDKAGTILLEDFAVATIPHAPFLLDKLWPQDLLKNPPTGALVVGGVKYDAELALPAPAAGTSRSGDPLVKPGAKLGWSFLPGTAAEATGVFGAATAKKLPVTALKDEQATASAVLAALPKAKYAHFATHGFFADPSFRGIFQLDEKDYEKSRFGERIGRAANSPLVMTGLVFAGANNPKTPGRGIVTGESLIDLDLSGLELAVLSACETGLGDVAGGEGTFGLQRAFHLAGTRDVVASLWKVPDQSTAALMALFYRNLWDKNLTPMESLRQAQLEIYRNPAKIPELAKGFRGKFEEVPGAVGDSEIKPGKEGKAHPLLWAAFTLSGPGR